MGRGASFDGRAQYPHTSARMRVTYGRFGSARFAGAFADSVACTRRSTAAQRLRVRSRCCVVVGSHEVR
jgi:hypothetical protein